MLKDVSGLPACCLLFSACLSAANSGELKGKVIDPSGAAISGAQIALINRVGVVSRTTSSLAGAFELDASDSPDAQLVVAAPGDGAAGTRSARRYGSGGRLHY